MKDKIKIVFFDVDGTLFSHDYNGFYQTTIEALKKLKDNNILISLATGRPYEMLGQLKPFLKEIDFDYYIVSNGQAVYQKDKLLYKNFINPEDVKAIIKKAKEKDLTLCLIGDNFSYTNKLTDLLIAAYKSVDYPIPDVFSFDETFNKPVDHLVVYEDLSTKRYFSSVIKHSVMTNWSISAYEFVPNNGVKANGIKMLLEHLNIDNENAMAFGDGHNDIEMLEYVGFGVAMGNASLDVQEKADYVTAHIDDDGLYKALKNTKLID